MVHSETLPGNDDEPKIPSGAPVVTGTRKGTRRSVSTMLGATESGDMDCEKVTRRKLSRVLGAQESELDLGQAMPNGSLEYIKGVVLPLITEFCSGKQNGTITEDNWNAFCEFCSRKQSGTTVEWFLQEMNKHRSMLEPHLNNKIKDVGEKHIVETEKAILLWLQQTQIDLQSIKSPEQLYALFYKQHASDVLLLEKEKTKLMPLFIAAYNSAVQKQKEQLREQETNDIEELEKEIAAWVQQTEIDLQIIKSPEQLYALFYKQHASHAPLLKKKKPTFMKLFTEAFNKAQEEQRKAEQQQKSDMKDLDGRVQSWLREPIDLNQVKSASDLKAKYLQHSQNKKRDGELMDIYKDHFDRLFTEAYKQEQKEVDMLEERIKAWIAKQKIDPTKVKSGEDLKKLYLQTHPQDKARCDTYKQRFDPLFVAAHKKALDAYEMTKKNAKADIATATKTLLKPEDIENDSLKTKTLFVAAMLARLQSILMQHQKPDALYKDLEMYAKILIEKLHTIWQKKHEALKNETMKEELSQIEKAVGAWKAPAGKPLANFDEFRVAFLQTCPYKEIMKKHEAFANASLKLKWEQYSISRDILETQSLQQTSKQSAATATAVSASMRAKAMGLDPAMAVALSKTESEDSLSALDDSIRSRFFGSVDLDSLSPAFTSVLDESRLSLGSERFLRLARSQKMVTLLAGREDTLAPFFFAMCGALENEGEIQRCTRELELSDNPQDTIRIIFASDACRTAADKLRRTAIWPRFISALSSLGVSLQDLHLHRDDEGPLEEDINTEIVQEVIKEREEPEDEQGEGDTSSVENERPNDQSGKEERVQLADAANIGQFAFSRRFARKNLTEAEAYKQALLAV